MLEFIRLYWVQLTFVISMIIALVKIFKFSVEGIKCSLRNDILSIYDRCKIDKKITHYQLESLKYSSQLYFKLKGNSFVKDIVDRVEEFELID